MVLFAVTFNLQLVRWSKTEVPHDIRLPGHQWCPTKWGSPQFAYRIKKHRFNRCLTPNKKKCPKRTTTTTTTTNNNNNHNNNNINNHNPNPNPNNNININWSTLVNFTDEIWWNLYRRQHTLCANQVTSGSRHLQVLSSRKFDDTLTVYHPFNKCIYIY